MKEPLNLDIQKYKNNPILNQERNQFSELTDPRENKLNRMSLMDGILSSKMESTTR